MSGNNSTPASTPIETAIATIWAKDLGTQDIFLESDFLELGGDSLRMLNMLFQLNLALAVEIPPGVLFENSTLKSFSQAVATTIDREQNLTDRTADSSFSDERL